MKKKYHKTAVEVQNLAARRETRKRESRESFSQATSSLAKEIDTNKEEPVSTDETEILERFAESSMEDSQTMDVGLLTIKSFNQVLLDAAKKKEPTKLFDEFWYEGETCCLFADSNVGKSILAVQIARNIATSQKVLYFDFELSEHHFLRRYTDDETKQTYKFPKNLYRVCLNYMMGEYPVEELPDKIMCNIEKSVRETGASVIIIDNLTWIAYNSKSPKMAGELMKRLSTMKVQYNLSMLILAHTPKRNMSKPITQNDLGGSKMIMNFLDSAFAIGFSSKDPNIRYIKQIKVRYAEMKYGEDNVWLCEMRKVRSFLMLFRLGFGMESEHLKKRKDGDKDALIAKIKVMKANGKSIREIAAELGMSPATVDRYSKK